MTELQDRVVIITGAGRGIGRATAEACARAGARLLLDDLGTTPEGAEQDPTVVAALADSLRAGGADVDCTDTDVTADGAPEALVERAVERFGRVDGLVCNAGFAREGLLVRAADDALDRMLDVHLRATMRLNRALARQLIAQGDGGAIVNTSSHAALFGARRQTALAAATAGVIGFSRSLSIELKRHDIRVNAIAPLARTRLTEALPMFQNIRSDSMTPAQVAPVTVFLLSDLARDVHGELVGVAGARVYGVAPRESTGVFFEQGPPSPEALAAAWSSIIRG